MRVFFNPAKSAAIPRLVPEEEVMAANALSSATMNVMQLAGLSVSGGVVAALYALSPNGFYAAAMGLNALSFLGSALFIGRLPPLLPERTHDLHPWEDFRQGFRYLLGRRDLRAMTILLAVFRLSIAPFFVFYLEANKQWFGNRPENLLWMEFSFFVGMLASSAVMGRVRPARPAVVVLHGSGGGAAWRWAAMSAFSRTFGADGGLERGRGAGGAGGGPADQHVPADERARTPSGAG